MAQYYQGWQVMLRAAYHLKLIDTSANLISTISVQLIKNCVKGCLSRVYKV
jgi:hypothetical protein